MTRSDLSICPPPLLVIINIPFQVFTKGLINYSAHLTGANGHMVFKAVFTDVPQQPLQTGDFDHAIPAEGLEGITGKSSLAGIGADLSTGVIGGHPAVREP